MFESLYQNGVVPGSISMHYSMTSANDAKIEPYHTLSTLSDPASTMLAKQRALLQNYKQMVGHMPNPQRILAAPNLL